MPEGAKPIVPAGFTVELLAERPRQRPRTIRVAPNGDIFVAESGADRVHRASGRKDDGDASRRASSPTGFDYPYGIAFYPPGPKPEWVYVAETDSVVRFPYTNGDLDGAERGRDRCSPAFPAAATGRATSPSRRTARRCCVAVGSRSNVGGGAGATCRRTICRRIEQNLGSARRGATRTAARRCMSFDPDGQERQALRDRHPQLLGHRRSSRRPATCGAPSTSATGSATTCRPTTSRGSSEGAFYGWPWYYIGDNEDPRHAGERPDLAGKITVPDVLLQAHSAPLSIAFYDGETFPGRVPRRRLRRAARLVEPRRAHRLQGRAHRHRRTACRPASTRTS